MRAEWRVNVNADALGKVALIQNSGGPYSGSGCPTSRGLMAPPSVVSNTVSDIVSAEPIMGELRVVGWSRLRCVIASDVGGAQLRDAVSKRIRISAM